MDLVDDILISIEKIKYKLYHAPSKSRGNVPGKVLII
jgi:hypothetical protein